MVAGHPDIVLARHQNRVSIACEELLPALFTPIARARLWRPFSDRQRLLAANMLVTHLNDVMSTHAEVASATPHSVLTTDRLSTRRCSRLHLLSLMRPIVPNDHLILVAATLLELSIDRRLTQGDAVVVGSIVLSSPASIGGSDDPYGARAVTRRMDALFDGVLSDRRFFTRRRTLRTASYQIELMSLTREPVPYLVESVEGA